jgi:hypothetical protein
MEFIYICTRVNVPDLTMAGIRKRSLLSIYHSSKSRTHTTELRPSDFIPNNLPIVKPLHSPRLGCMHRTSYTQGAPFKMQLKQQSRTTVPKLNHTRFACVIYSLDFLVTLEAMSPLAARLPLRLSQLKRTLCRCAHSVLTSRTCVYKI